MSAKRLLIVDDEPDFGAFVRRVAVEMGYDVEVTTGAKAFKDAYKRINPTVITLDVVMPEVDGIELIRWLAEIGCTARIVIISGFDPSYALMTEHMGARSGLSSITRLRKPLSIAELQKALA